MRTRQHDARRGKDRRTPAKRRRRGDQKNSQRMGKCDQRAGRREAGDAAVLGAFAGEAPLGAKLARTRPRPPPPPRCSHAESCPPSVCLARCLPSCRCRPCRKTPPRPLPSLPTTTMTTGAATMPTPLLRTARMSLASASGQCLFPASCASRGR